MFRREPISFMWSTMYQIEAKQIINILFACLKQHTCKTLCVDDSKFNACTGNAKFR